jgi:dethiobiotin synthetase
MAKGFFITATGTGEGKTLFSAGLLLLLRHYGINAAPLKAVQTGAGKTSPDLVRIFKLTGFKPGPAEIGYMQPFLFRDGCSPHLAAERQKKPYASAGKIQRAISFLSGKYEMIITEGAGGVLVPVDRKKKTYMADIIRKTGFPVILVAPAGLGAINQACLSIEAMKNRKIKIAGYVLNNARPEKDSYIAKDNARVIEQFTGIKYLGTLPFIKHPAKKILLRSLKKMTGLNSLIKRI